MGGAQRNPSAGNLTEKTPDAARAWAANLTNVDPAQQAALRSAATQGIQTGARGEATQQIAKAGLEGGRAGVLASPALSVSGPAADQRALLGQRGFEDILKGVRGEAAADQPAHRFMHLPWKERIAMDALRKPDVMSTPAAKNILSDITADPAKYQDVLAQFGKGQDAIKNLVAWVSAQGGSAAGRR